VQNQATRLAAAASDPPSQVLLEIWDFNSGISVNDAKTHMYFCGYDVKMWYWVVIEIKQGVVGKC
jgi:hypothetical protein